MSTDGAGNGGRLHALTGARFFAALHVLLFHYGGALFVGLPAWAERFRDSGYAAVSFFFVVSGFILSYQYGPAVAAGTFDARKFWVNRFARIYPVYALGLVALVPLAWDAELGRATFGDASLLAKVVTLGAHLTMTQSWVPRLVASWNLPGWSLCVEAAFYASFPFAIALLVRLRSRKALLLVIAGAWLASLAAPLAYVLTNPEHLRWTTPASRGFWLTLIKVSPLMRFPEFVGGAALGRLHSLAGKAPSRRGGWIAALAATSAATLVCTGVLPYPLIHNGALMPLFALVVLGLARGGGAPARLLSHRAFVVLGDASYSLYILQFPLMSWAHALLGPAASVKDPTFILAYLAVLTALSLAVYAGFERPAQQWVRRAMRGRKAVVPATLSAPR